MKLAPFYERKCGYCHRPFVTGIEHKLYCDEHCRRYAAGKRKHPDPDTELEQLIEGASNGKA